MSQFNRGISAEFVKRLNAEYAKNGGWWRSIADDRDLFVAIRKEYINVYLNGNSLLKLRLEGDDLVGETHYKYLLTPESKQPYVRVVDGQAQINSHAGMFLPGFSHLQDIKRAADAYYGDEKRGVHQIVMSNSNVIDVEIAFGSENEQTGKNTAKRIDFAALRRQSSGLTVAFYEAKLFASPELRKKDTPVLRQIQRYDSFLRREREAIIDSYRTVCENIVALDGVRNRYAHLQNVIHDLATLSIQDDVRLVVFGFDDDQKKGANWAIHKQNLTAALGNRLLLKGTAKDFTSGIASHL